VIKAEPPIALKADIELREKKISKTQVAKPTAKEIKVRRLAEEQRLLEEYAEMRRQSEQVRVRAEQDRVRAEVSAATAAEVGRYQDMIRNKIRRNIVMPPDLEESVTSEFKVTLLPGGMVMEVILMKSSGNPAYDNAAERAIYKSQPLPIPKDTELQKLFRELRLTIRP
jgi:colicin import membrane protein